MPFIVTTPLDDNVDDGKKKDIFPYLDSCKLCSIGSLPALQVAR